MTDVDLHGPLALAGPLDLVPDGGGKVLVNGTEALVEGAEGTSVVVPIPTPQSPSDLGTVVKVVSSLGKTVTAKGTPLVTTGMVLQGTTWPGMVLPSAANTGPVQVSAGGLAINVKGDQAQIFPTGAPVSLDQNRQG